MEPPPKRCSREGGEERATKGVVLEAKLEEEPEEKGAAEKAKDTVETIDKEPTKRKKRNEEICMTETAFLLRLVD